MDYAYGAREGEDLDNFVSFAEVLIHHGVDTRDKYKPGVEACPHEVV